jgi:hypothetical protein
MNRNEDNNEAQLVTKETLASDLCLYEEAPYQFTRLV